MFNFESSSLSWVRDARADERRNSRRDVLCRIALLNVGAGLDDTRLETGGTADGTAGTAMLGGGGAGILAALPMPLGSLTELLRPPALPGPRGMPLTPASCAKDGADAAIQPANARAKKHDLPTIDHASPRNRQSTCCKLRGRSRFPKFHPRIAVMTANEVPFSRVFQLAEEANMKDAKTYREYAADCIRMARLLNPRLLNPNDKQTLLKMAEAWEERAREAERQENKPDGAERHE
jgi:hypothetical protein